jgi:hypothetical protein
MLRLDDNIIYKLNSLPDKNKRFVKPLTEKEKIYIISNIEKLGISKIAKNLKISEKRVRRFCKENEIHTKRIYREKPLTEYEIRYIIKNVPIYGINKVRADLKISKKRVSKFCSKNMIWLNKRYYNERKTKKIQLKETKNILKLVDKKGIAETSNILKISSKKIKKILNKNNVKLKIGKRKTKLYKRIDNKTINIIKKYVPLIGRTETARKFNLKITTVSYIAELNKIYFEKRF